jgi:hypothetical protein
MVRILILLLAMAGGLAACAHEPRVVGAAPPGVSYRFQGDNIAEPNQRASQYCQQWGRLARLQNVEHSGSDKVAVYECD